MKVVLVNIGIFQEYIFYCIKQLQLHGNTNITLITDRKFFDKYAALGGAATDGIELVASEDLDDMDYHLWSNMTREFRDGFVFYASQRLFFVYSYMKLYSINDCVHIENDNMIYVNLDDVFPGVTAAPPPRKLCAVFDSPARVIPSILYIPSAAALGEILRGYRSKLNDMENLGARADAIERLPIIPPRCVGGGEAAPYAQNFGRFGENYIFDGAAMGQYLGGIDPRNTTEENTQGFVNETCVVKYNQFEFTWHCGTSGLYCPYLISGGSEFPIVNLHIHSKNLADFLSPQN